MFQFPLLVSTTFNVYIASLIAFLIVSVMFACVLYAIGSSIAFTIRMVADSIKDLANATRERPTSAFKSQHVPSSTTSSKVKKTQPKFEEGFIPAAIGKPPRPEGGFGAKSDS